VEVRRAPVVAKSAARPTISLNRICAICHQEAAQIRLRFVGPSNQILASWRSWPSSRESEDDGN